MCTVCHGFGGKTDFAKGSGLVFGTFALQAKQLDNKHSTSGSVFRNHIFLELVVLFLPYLGALHDLRLMFVFLVPYIIRDDNLVSPKNKITCVINC